jgi:signal transduction histidine kinase
MRTPRLLEKLGLPVSLGWVAFLSGLLCACSLAAAEPTPSAELPLSSIQQIRALSPEQAKTGRPVKLRGVVTFSIPSIATLFIHDGSCGIFVERTPGPNENGPAHGDFIEVSGITGEGLFAPVIKGANETGASIRWIKHQGLPEPRNINGLELSEPSVDSDWVSIDARVSEVLMDGGDLILACLANNHEFRVLLEGPLPQESVPWDLAEARIRVRGVVATSFNSSRQMTARFLRTASLDDIILLENSSHLPPEPKLVRADELLQIEGPGPDELVRIRGVATLALPGQGVFLQVDDGGIWVQTAQPISAAPGTVIEVIGWPRPGEMKPFIRARRVTMLGTSAPPQARALTARQALSAQHDADWVSLQAELIDSFHSPEGTLLELRDREMVFRCLLPDDSAQSPPRTLRRGSKLEISGIAKITPSGNFILRVEDTLLLLARSSADVKVLAPPPFWTARNVSISAAAIITALLTFYGIARARRRREAKAQRREFDAVLAERGRFAREIHDSLAQGLTSISLQLECVRDQIPKNPGNAATHVETARSLVRESLREARRTVWNLRPLALGEADLADSIQRYATQLSRDGSVSISQQIEGTPRPLPPDHEAALLRIGQEALTNAARHSAATEIKNRLRYGNGWITLTITDNGVGFDVTTRVGKGFGLTGMHERVSALGGSLSIDSQPGQGTELSATLPT